MRPGESRESEELFLLLGEDRNIALSKYARELACNKQLAIQQQKPPTGWCSWSAFFEKVTLQDILENLEAAAQLKRELPLDYFQLDDF